jgi:hypothetical protein
MTGIADLASDVTGLSTSGAEARVKGGNSEIPKLPLSGGAKRRSKKSKKSRKSKSKSRKTRSHRRKTSKK